MIIFPNCKINLGLHILQKRADGFHNLETVFYPVPLQDGLEIITADSSIKESIQFSTSGLNIGTSLQDNICVKAFLLLKKEFPHLPPIQMHLHKVIPSGAGLGGGSADAAFTLMLLNKKYNLGLSNEQLMRFALQLGSDCPFFILNTPCFATGRGEQLKPVSVNISGYRLILVNPKIHISTAEAFSKITPNNDRTSPELLVNLPVSQWKDVLHNDFENGVFKLHPETKKIKEQLYETGAIYASMSGSGSTVYGIFDKSIQPQLNFPPHYFVKSI